MYIGCGYVQNTYSYVYLLGISTLVLFAVQKIVQEITSVLSLGMSFIRVRTGRRPRRCAVTKRLFSNSPDYRSGLAWFINC